MFRILGLAVSVVTVLTAFDVSAQDNKAGCSQSPSPPATSPNAGSSSGSQPGHMGSTGWSGGTGGSNIGTHPAAPTPGSPTEQPPTAQGLDPTKSTGSTNPC